MIPRRCLNLRFQDLTHALSVGLRTATAPGNAAYSPAQQGEKKHAEIPTTEVLGGFCSHVLFRKVGDFWKFDWGETRRYKIYKIRYGRSGFEKDTKERTGFEDQWNRPRKLFESLTGSSWFQTRACRHFHPMLGARSLVVTQKQKNPNNHLTCTKPGGKWKMDRWITYDTVLLTT